MSRLPTICDTAKTEAVNVIKVFPIVVAEHLFIEVAEQVKRFYRNVGSIQSALEATPKVFDTIGVDAAINVLLRVIDDAVNIIRRHVHVAGVVIGIKLGACRNAFRDSRMNRCLLAIGTTLVLTCPPRSKHSHDDGLAPVILSDRSFGCAWTCACSALCRR